VAAGIRYAAKLGADIINLSLGGGYSRTIEEAIDYARALGSLVVVAAGNESASMPSFPARFSATKDNVLSVGAINSTTGLAGFSNRVGASGAQQVDAPGAGIYSTWLNGAYATLSGTSMAAPHVAGLAALALSANQKLSAAQIRNLILGGAVERSTDSDSVGLAKVQTTVAYASAGLLSVVRSPASPAPTNSATSSTWIYATGFVPDAIFSSVIVSQDRSERSVNFEPPLDSVIGRVGPLQAAPSQLEYGDWGQAQQLSGADQIFKQFFEDEVDLSLIDWVDQESIAWKLA
jgi:subtilisin family serine protease